MDFLKVSPSKKLGASEAVALSGRPPPAGSEAWLVQLPRRLQHTWGLACPSSGPSVKRNLDSTT